jgi:hypothetical protein
VLSIEAFVKAGEEAISDGDMAFVADLIDVPNSVYLGSKIIYFSDRATLIGVLLQYRGNLLKMGYNRTVFRNIATSIVGPNTVRATLDWANLNASGEKISGEHMCCYLKRTDASKWRITFVSFGKMPSDEVMQGLPIY